MPIFIEEEKQKEKMKNLIYRNWGLASIKLSGNIFKRTIKISGWIQFPKVI